MGKIHMRISDDVEEMFRDTVGAKWGYKKGNLGRAFEEALILWIVKEKKV